jgi:uncharacterized protein involved in outer membrane biogenesis
MVGRRYKLVIKVLFGGLLSLVLTCVGLLAYISSADLIRHRPLIESLASKATGRAISIEGPLDIDLGRKIEIRVGRVQLGNAEWAAEPYMLDLRDSRVVLRTSSLLNTPLWFSEISVGSASIIVDNNPTRGLNWVFGEPGSEKAAPPASGQKPAFPVIVKELDARQLNILYRGPNLARDLTLLVNSLTITENPAQRLEVSAAGVLADKNWSLAGDLGSVASLLSGRALSGRIDLALGTASLTLAAQAESLSDLAGIRATLDVSGADLEILRQSIGFPKISQGPFTLKSEVTLDRGTLEAKLRASAGELEASIDLDATELEKTIPSINAVVSSRGPNLGALARLLGVDGLEEAPFSASGKFHNQGEQLQFEHIRLEAPNTQIALNGNLTRPPDYLGTQVSLNARLPETSGILNSLGIDWLKPGSLVVAGTLEQGSSGLILSGAKLEMSNTQLTASGKIGNLDTLAGTLLALELSSPGADQLGNLLNQQDWPSIPLQAGAQLQITPEQFLVDEGRVTLGTANALVSGSIARSPGPIQANLALDLDAPSIGAFGPVLGMKNIPDLPLQGRSRIRIDGPNIAVESWAADVDVAQLEGSANLDFEKPGGARLYTEVRARGKSLNALSQALELGPSPDQPWQASTRISSDAGSIRMTGLEMAMATVSLRGQAEYVPGSQFARVEVKVEGPDVRLLHAGLQEEATRPVPFTLELALAHDKTGTQLNAARGNLGDLALEASGKLGNWEDLSGFDLKIGMRTKDLASVLSAWTAEPGPAVSFDVAGNLTSGPRQVLLSADARLGQDKIAVQGTVADQGSKTAPLRRFEIQVSGDNINLDRLQALWPKPDEPTPTTMSARLIPDLQFPNDWPSNLEGTAELKIAHLRSWDSDLEAVHLAANLDRNGLSVHTAQANLGQGTLEGKLQLSPADSGIRANLDFSARNIRLMLMPSSIAEQARPPVDIDASLSGQGKGLRELAATLDGSYSMRHGKGQADFRKGFYTSDFLKETINLVNPFAKQEPVTLLECGLVVLKAEKGMITADVAMLQTNRLLLGVEGQANLKTEGIEVLFTIVGREGLGVSASSIVNPYVKVTGTLAKPTLSFAPTRAALNYGAAVATGGLSLLAKGIWDRMSSSGEVCEKEVAKRGYVLPGTA